MSMKKYRLFFLGLIVMGALLGSFHHHDDGLSNNNCLVCTVQHTLDISGDLHVYSLEKIDTYFSTVLMGENSYKNALVYSYTLSRAPPYFS